MTWLCVLFWLPTWHDERDGGDEPVGCAAACVSWFCWFQGKDVSVDVVRGRLPLRPEGHSLAEMASILHDLGVAVNTGKVPITELPTKVPFIAHIVRPTNEVGHFVFVTPIEGSAEYVMVYNPPLFPRIYRRTDLTEQFKLSGWVITPRSSALPLIWLGVAGATIVFVRFLRRRLLKSVASVTPKTTSGADGPNATAARTAS